MKELTPEAFIAIVNGYQKTLKESKQPPFMVAVEYAKDHDIKTESFVKFLETQDSPSTNPDVYDFAKSLVVGDMLATKGRLEDNTPTTQIFPAQALDYNNRIIAVIDRAQRSAEDETQIALKTKMIAFISNNMKIAAEFLGDIQLAAEIWRERQPDVLELGHVPNTCTALQNGIITLIVTGQYREDVKRSIQQWAKDNDIPSSSLGYLDAYDNLWQNHLLKCLELIKKHHEEETLMSYELNDYAAFSDELATSEMFLDGAIAGLILSGRDDLVVTEEQVYNVFQGPHTSDRVAWQAAREHVKNIKNKPSKEQARETLQGLEKKIKSREELFPQYAPKIKAYVRLVNADNPIKIFSQTVKQYSSIFQNDNYVELTAVLLALVRQDEIEQSMQKKIFEELQKIKDSGFQGRLLNSLINQLRE
jgi:hypothetical protein